MRRYLQGTEIPVVLTTAVVQLVGANPRRRSLTFSGNATSSVHFSTDPTMNVAAGLCLQFQNQPFTLYYDLHGDIVQKAWFGAASAAGTRVSILEATEADAP